jgi:sterol desaturase/sphingolipid hydroxylase (fatty acid hydroxylase superfamily)
MTSTQYLLLGGLFLGYTVLEFALGHAQRFGATLSDNLLDFLCFAVLAVFTQPFILWCAKAIGLAVAPQYENALADLPWYAMVALLLVGDDMVQYGWHRASHSPLLWPLHRAHHSAEYMSIRVTFRNNFFYYLMMPGLWFAGALLYLGFGGMVYALYIAVKLFVILGAHSAWRWDEPLYRIRALHPLMWVLERTISTPATHWAHHAITNNDGVGHYKGNFGNLLFFWDILFGSAHITRQYPAKVGLIDDKLFGQERWYHQMFYPLLQSKREHSALKFGGTIYAEPEEMAKSH